MPIVNLSAHDRILLVCIIENYGIKVNRRDEN
jgi:hypothetical protein